MKRHLLVLALQKVANQLKASHKRPSQYNDFVDDDDNDDDDDDDDDDDSDDDGHLTMSPELSAFLMQGERDHAAAACVIIRGCSYVKSAKFGSFWSIQS